MQSIPSHHLAIWLLLMGLWMSCVMWHSHENRALLRKMGMAGLNVAFVAQMVRFAWSRSAQQLIIVFVVAASLIAYDWHRLGFEAPSIVSAVLLDHQNAQVIELAQNTIWPQTNPQWQFATVAPAPAAIPDAQAFAELAPAAGDIHQIPAVTPSPQQELDALRQAGLVQQIYAPETSGAQAALDGIKQRYEDVLVTYFFLNKCGRAREEDYHIIYSSLAQELAVLNAEAGLQPGIVSAARGSYQEIYSRISCSSQNLDSIEAQFHTYTNALMQAFSAYSVSN